ncbi:MAG: dynamin family protein [Trichocoleus desertorum ATA4-8-CV12]|jgi:uncharacterized tellurite resistance protein B-like protein|nr:dynamin family protein [Trichocoleus desertorum ATA4-8-CV12]
MELTRINSETIELLSRITGQNLRREDLSPSIVFLSALITVLQGVMLQDGQITEEEKQQWQKTINRFIPANSNIRSLVQLISKGIRNNRIYTSAKDLLTLTTPLSEAERLLLIGLGYEMSATDGSIATSEKKYLEAIADKLQIQPKYLSILEAGFTHKSDIDITVLREVQSLIDPVKFYDLDAFLVKAASDILSVFSGYSNQGNSQKRKTIDYDSLTQFQVLRGELKSLCLKISAIARDCKERNFIPINLLDEFEQEFQKLNSESFRVSVIGEFSKGKSTLLNALLGEEIQPVREIPCSGQVTVLKYGEERRVTCHHKDGRVEEISFEEYKEKASISEEAALGNSDDEFVNNSIEEIIFEDPGLSLCRNGIEILDSPGLNEHPNRTEITQKLIKDIDAAIFLTSAFQPLNQGERELLSDLRYYLNDNKIDQPTDKIFVLVNFWDSITSDVGRKQIQRRVVNLLQNQPPIIDGEARIHFVSAKETLNSILNDTKNEYLDAFNAFTKSLEKFLINERGIPRTIQYKRRIDSLIKTSLDFSEQAQKSLDGELKVSDAEKQKIVEKIGEASGRDIRIKLFADSLIDEIIEETNVSWDEWIEGLDERLSEKVASWSSKHSAIFSRDQLIKDYVNQFNRDLSQELEGWIENQLKQNVLSKKIKHLDDFINQELKAIEREFNSISRLSDSTKKWVFLGNPDDIFKDSGVLGNIGLAGLGAAVLVPAFIFAGPILLIIGSLVGGGFLGIGAGGVLGLDQEIRNKVFETGCEKFVESLESVFEKLFETIEAAVSERSKQADEIIGRAISFYENLLEQQERTHSETLEKREADKRWIALKSEELKQIQNQIELVLTKHGVEY